MERALNGEHLRIALGEGGLLPTPEELQNRLADAEIAIFLRHGLLDDDLLGTAWYLHAVGSARPSLQLYEVDRQLRANQVGAHILDLALAAGDRSQVERQEMTFAAQVSYLRGGQAPNAQAVYQRIQPRQRSLRDAPGEVSLDVGSALLALDRVQLFPRLDALRREVGLLRAVVGVADLIETPYGSAARVIEGCNELLIHLTYNRPERLDRARRLFDEAVHPPFSQSDLDSRWVAAHLRDITDDLATSSVWAILPPTVPASAARAMTLGDPPVLSLWPPQHQLLRLEPSPLGPESKRLVLSLPTSAGKTLIAQYIVAAHVASGLGSACVVAPTHSLGRELQRDLDRRLGTVGDQAADAGPLGVELPQDASAVVMTPEKFAAHLRNEPEEMLQKFSLFLIDEAHLVGDADRGWVLESALSLLHRVTLETPHRIVLMSAALGNRSHVAAWLHTASGDAQVFQHDWRGPRRAHAVLGTDADWKAPTPVPMPPRGRLNRRHVPLYGQIHVRTAPGRHTSLRTVQPIGSLLQAERGGLWKKEASGGDPAYRLRARMALVLGAQGPVLMVEPTKLDAQRIAGAVADEIGDDDPACAALVALARTRLGSGHPLVATLSRGVGFHHAALPADVQAELEDGFRKGPLNYLAATTTLIEGVNFPVRTVLIGERGYRSSEGVVTTLDAAKLLNAIGRAGRACRETEGWVVLWISEEFSEKSFEILGGTDTDLIATSRLATSTALDALADFEELLRASEDAVLSVDGNAVAGFISHVWFVASALEELSVASTDPVSAAIETTLAWQQISVEDRARWRRITALAMEAYEATPSERRTRWARSGTTLPSAAELEAMANEVLAELPFVADRTSPLQAFALTTANGRLERLLALSEARTRRFRPRRNAPSSEEVPVSLVSLVTDWLKGSELDELGERHLGTVQDEAYRYEQLSEFSSQVLEHLLPWLLGTVVAWVNQRLDDDEEKLCPDLSAFVRFGVDKPVALELARGGVRSRRLVHEVANTAPTDAELDIREWLASTDLRQWADLFGASPTEIADLIVFTRARDARVTSRVLAGEIVEIPLLRAGEPPTGATPVELREVDEAPPARLAAFGEAGIIGHVRAGHHDDLARLRAIGVPLITSVTSAGTLTIRIDDPSARDSWFQSTPS